MRYYSKHPDSSYDSQESNNDDEISEYTVYTH